MNPRVLVVVVTHNGMHWLRRCLSSVMPGAKTAGSAPEVDVYVWDNASTDGSADFVAENYPQAVLVRSRENLGFSIPNNKGFEYAVREGYDYAYLLNQDAWIEPVALDLLVASARAHPEYGVLSPLQMTDGYKELDRQFARLLPADTKQAPFVPGKARDRDGEDVVEVRRVMAAHWLVRVEALKGIGQFSGIFPFYGQDDDWCNRARYHGWRIGIVPEARAVHDRAQRKEAKERIIDRNYRVGSLVRLCDINRPLWERFLFVCAFTLVKSVKYLSFAPFRHFAGICSRMKEIKSARMAARKGGMKFV